VLDPKDWDVHVVFKLALLKMYENDLYHPLPILKIGLG
jgi:hypothetical protein